MGDGGLAAGAALDAWHRGGGTFAPRELDHVYLGPAYTEYEMERTLARYPELTVSRPRAPVVEVARLLAERKIVARFDGAMEYGPRSLGNRSILCHARDASMNDWLNKRLQRSEFMPFAPVTTQEAAPLFFAGFDPARSRAARFMTVTYDVTERCLAEAPAIVHVDRTARPQVVRREWNPAYHDLIEEYGRLTHSPILVNTSFNMHEEPIVSDPDTAIRSFLKSGLDALALGPFLVTRA
jgi:carbamoyltransferase